MDDGAAAVRYHAAGPVTVLSPETVEIGVVEFDPFNDPGTWLTAGAGNGIVAVNGGTAWAGVTGLELPFP